MTLNARLTGIACFASFTVGVLFANELLWLPFPIMAVGTANAIRLIWRG